MRFTWNGYEIHLKWIWDSLEMDMRFTSNCYEIHLNNATSILHTFSLVSPSQLPISPRCPTWQWPQSSHQCPTAKTPQHRSSLHGWPCCWSTRYHTSPSWWPPPWPTDGGGKKWWMGRWWCGSTRKRTSIDEQQAWELQKHLMFCRQQMA